MSNNKLHDRRVHEIVTTPTLVGLDGIILSTHEANVFSNQPREEGMVIGQPDGLAFDPTTHTLYNIEYKCGDNREKAWYQLARNGAVLQAVFADWNVVDVYVHGKDYHVETKDFTQRGGGRFFHPARRNL